MCKPESELPVKKYVPTCYVGNSCCDQSYGFGCDEDQWNLKYIMMLFHFSVLVI